MDEAIAAIAGNRRLAVVGVSDRKFGGAVYKELKRRGYDLYAVHPARDRFDNDPCYRSLRDVPDGVTAAIVLVSGESAVQIVDDAHAAGYTHLWFQQGAKADAAVSQARSKGLETVTGKCILMYAEPVTGIHAFHRFVWRLFGKA